LAVRLVAPMNYRLENFAKRFDLDLKTAKEKMETIDKFRGAFIEHHFGRYAYDPRRYDLVINVSQFPREGVVDMIVGALQAKAGSQLVLPVEQTSQAGRNEP